MLMFKWLKKRRAHEKREETAEEVHQHVEQEEYPRLQARPARIAVGSNKGGAGKSFISTNLSLLVGTAAALGEAEPPLIVDLNIGPATTTRMLIPPQLKHLQHKACTGKISGAMLRILSEKLEGHIAVTEMLRGQMPTGHPLKLRNRVRACDGRNVESHYDLIPAVPVTSILNIEPVDWATIPGSVIDAVARNLSIYIEAQKYNTVIIDLPAEDINNPRVHRSVMKYLADFYIYVTEPFEEMDPSMINSFLGYIDARDRSLIVVNKVSKSKLASEDFIVSIRSLARMGYPVLIVPFDKRLAEDEQSRAGMHRMPLLVTVGLDSIAAKYLAALGLYINVITVDTLEKLECRDIPSLLIRYARFFKNATGWSL